MSDQQTISSGGPRVLITGASGLVGSHLLKALGQVCKVYAVDIVKPKEYRATIQKNIQWLFADLGDREEVKRIARHITKDGGVDFVFHFAAFYDFTNSDNSEYIRTNINGTRYLLENCQRMGVKRFIFSSSLTVTQFSGSSKQITENSPLDATMPYARSKQAAEDIIREHSEQIPCTIVRMAAIFSDWGEHGPLYILLKKWLNGGWQSRFIVGHGETALPYLHINDLTNLWLKIIANNAELSPFDIILASPDGCWSHNDIYQFAHHYYSGQAKKAFYIPVWLATLGILALKPFSLLSNSMPMFEKLWMLKYIDSRMDVDASASRRIIDWSPTDQYLFKTRMQVLIDNMKNNRDQWEKRNLPMAFRYPAEKK